MEAQAENSLLEMAQSRTSIVHEQGPRSLRHGGREGKPVPDGERAGHYVAGVGSRFVPVSNYPALTDWVWTIGIDA